MRQSKKLPYDAFRAGWQLDVNWMAARLMTMHRIAICHLQIAIMFNSLNKIIKKKNLICSSVWRSSNLTAP